MNVIAFPTPDQENFILPFQLEKSNLRGRVVCLGSVLDDILKLHNYPKPVSHLTAEAITLSLALSSMLKFEGIFTLQTQGDGPVGMIVSDVRSPAHVRGCAHFNEERVEKAREQLEAMKSPETAQNQLAQYLGKGHLAFTVDRKGEYERYQGIVPLEGASLIDCVQNYFKQSEQIGTGIHMAVGERDGKWRACAIMLQTLPEDEVNDNAPSNVNEDDWRRSMALMHSATTDEMLSDDISTKDLLFRLFHEEGVRVFDQENIKRDCRCTPERIQDVIRMLPQEDRDYIVKDGHIEMTCEFCSKIFKLDPKSLDLIED